MGHSWEDWCIRLMMGSMAALANKSFGIWHLMMILWGSSSQPFWTLLSIMSRSALTFQRITDFFICQSLSLSLSLECVMIWKISDIIRCNHLELKYAQFLKQVIYSICWKWLQWWILWKHCSRNNSGYCTFKWLEPSSHKTNGEHKILFNWT